MIAIPNMEKPKSCDVCRILRAEFDGSYDNPVTGCRQRMGIKNTLREEYDLLILDCPLIDIVTCGECKYWENGTCEQWSDPHEFDIRETDPDGFCYYGERRSDV